MFLAVLVLTAAAGAARGAAVATARSGVEDATGLRLHPLMNCLKEADTSACVQRRAFRYLEDWLVRGEESGGLDRSEEDLATLPPYLARIIDGLAEGISSWWTGEDPEDGSEARAAKTDDHLVSEGALRGHKKKKKEKLTKIATTVILLILYFIKSQLFYLFDYVARTAIFAGFALVAKVFVLLKFVELKRYLWWIKEDKKEYFHHEVSHHDHHYDHYDDHDHWFGWKGWPWSRRSARSGQDLAFRAHAPAQ